MSVTTFRDRFDLPLSTGSAEAVAHYVEGVDRILSLNLGAGESLERALAADGDFALAYAARALLELGQFRLDAAKASAERAQTLVAGASKREQGHVEAIAAAVDRGNPRTLPLMREHLAEFPRDALLLRQAIFAITFSGSSTLKQDARALMESVAGAYGEEWSYLSGAAMMHQEWDEFDEARRLGERSLVLYPRNALAAHPLAHVYFETDDHVNGAGFLGGWMTEYDREAPYHCHLSWHMTLFELASGRYGRMMQRYEEDIASKTTIPGLSLADASALLWRLQTYGCTTAAPSWEALRARAAPIAAQPGLGFVDAHVAMICAAAGDEAALRTQVDGLRALDAKGHPIAGTVTLPLVQGIAAFARGDYAETIRQIAPVAGEIVRVGGSNAQREVFEDTLLEAYLRANRYDEAEALLRRRLKRRTSARDFFWLGRAQAGRGEREAAAGAFAEARRRWQDADADAAEIAALERERLAVADV